jgi:phosphoenolpyruvate synthase/pyruvate phosphate dikinase
MGSPIATEQAADYVRWLDGIGLEAIAQVGGKNASLGELIAALGPRGVRVPAGFVLTAAAFPLHLTEAGLDRSIYTELDRPGLAVGHRRPHAHAGLEPDER